MGLRDRAGFPWVLLQSGTAAAGPSAPDSLLPHQRGPPGGDQTEGKGSRPGNYFITGGRKVSFPDGVGVKVTSCGSQGNRDPQVAHLKEEVAHWGATQ